MNERGLHHERVAERQRHCRALAAADEDLRADVRRLPQEVGRRTDEVSPQRLGGALLVLLPADLEIQSSAPWIL